MPVAPLHTGRIVTPDYAAMVDSLADGVLALDGEWRITYANPAARAISQLTAADLNSRPYWELWPETLGTELERLLREAMDHKAHSEITFRFERFDLWLQIWIGPSASGITLFYRDITKQKLAEDLRDESLRELEQLYDATSDGILSFDRHWRCTFLNRVAKEITLDQGELLGRTLWEVFPEAAQPSSEFYLNFHRSMNEGLISRFEAFNPAPLDGWWAIESRPSADGMVLLLCDITQRRRDEEAMRASESRYRLVTELGPHMLFVLAPDGTRNFANSRMLDFVGLSLAELQGDGWAEVCHPEDRELVARSWWIGLQTGEPVEYEARLRFAATGAFRWFLTRGSPVLDAAGAVLNWVGVATDIHDRRLSSDALIASEARYRVLADLNPQAIWMGAPDGRITYANQGYLDYIGLRIDETDRWIEVFDPIDRDRILATWAHCIATGSDYEAEAHLIRAADGASRLWALRAQPVRDTEGKILHWLGVANDIHEQRTAADALHQKQMETERQRAELEAVYLTAPIGLALLDPVEFRFLRANKQEADILGLPLEAIIDRSLEELAPIPGLLDLMRGVAAGRPIRNYVVEGELPSHPGERRSWNVNYFPVFAPDGSVQAISTASMEITKQKKSEAALIQSEKLAAVGRLASSISHEINNPLEAVTNLLYLVGMDHSLADETRAYVRMAQSELSRVAQIATQTLRFHRQSVRPTYVAPGALIDAVLNLYQGRLANSHIKVEASYATSSPILCFENDIRQVLNNLIANAIDAMRNGGRLMLRAHDAFDLDIRHPAPRRGIRLTVADTGHGMSEVTQRRVFEPFYTTKDLNGTGLGLWISQGIVSRHKGHLNLRSSQNPSFHGTVFSLFLPAEVVPEEIEVFPL